MLRNEVLSHSNSRKVKLRMAGEGDDQKPVLSGYGAVFYRDGDEGTEYHLCVRIAFRLSSLNIFAG